MHIMEDRQVLVLIFFLSDQFADNDLSVWMNPEKFRRFYIDDAEWIEWEIAPKIPTVDLIRSSSSYQVQVSISQHFFWF